MSQPVSYRAILLSRLAMSTKINAISLMALYSAFYAVYFPELNVKYDQDYAIDNGIIYG